MSSFLEHPKEPDLPLATPKRKWKTPFVILAALQDTDHKKPTVGEAGDVSDTPS